MSNNNRRPMPAESPETAALIFSATGFKTGNNHESEYQPHAAKLCVGCYALHLPSGKAGRVNGTAVEETIECARPKFTRVFGIAYDCEYPSTVLRRITPKQYKALPNECKIVSGETGIF